MVKGRVRVKTGKAKRWRKGHSGGTNPESKTHREAAKGKFGSHLAQVKRNDAATTLTTEVLASHDAYQKDVSLQEDNGNQLLEEGTQSEGANSSAYNLIETSHPLFGKVKRLWNSPDESHREICAVLAAVSEVVKLNAGQDSEIEYFAALLTALESSEEETSSAAISFLLSIVMEQIPQGILETRFSLVSKILMSQLTANETTESTALLKSLISCLTVLLSAQPASMWEDSSVQSMLQTIINFAVHPKPRLRKGVQRGVVSMLREGGGGEPNHAHPSCSLIAKQCKRMIETGANDTVKLHVLGFLKECLGNFTTKSIKGLCEVVLKLLTLGNSIMKMTGFQCLNGLFLTNAGPQGLTAQLNGQLISALYDQQPSIADTQLLMAWTTVMESAHLSLLRLDYSICIAHLPTFCTALMKCLLAKKRTSVNLTAKILQNFLKTCIGSVIQHLTEDTHEEQGKSTSSRKWEEEEESSEYICLRSIFSSIETGLKYKFYEVWDLVLGLLETFYSVAGGKCSKFMTKSLQSLNELHNTPNFSCVAELEAAFGAAVKSLGPRFVLNTVPLNLDEMRDQLDFPQSWILPVLKSSVQKTDLAFYVEDLLPLAGKMRVLSQQWKVRGKELEGKLYETLEHQIWSLLPSFCRDCTDITTSFSSVAKILGTALSTKPEVCLVICQALINLIEGSRNNESDQAQLTKFSKNYLPVLFNLYTAEPSAVEHTRDTVLNCIKSYLSITEKKLLNSLFTKLLSRLRDQSSSPHLRTALEDIAEAFTPFLSQADLNSLFQLISPILDSGDPTAQKKAYKLLSSLLSCDSPDHEAFIAENLTVLREILIGSLSTAGTGSKKPRLRCLLQVVSRIDSNSADFIPAVVPEAILCTKETNEKCRNISYQLLKGLGYAAQTCYETTPEESIQKYFSLVLAGLAGSSHMVSATIGAMARLVYEFSDLLGSELISKLLSSVCVFFSARAKEVVRSTLVFIKVAIGVLPPTELAPHVEELVLKILKWNESHNSHFRMKSRFILERLTRKFGYKMIEGFVPKKHKRLMVHIRKTSERQKRLQRMKLEDKDKGDDEDIVVRKMKAKPSFEKLILDSDDEEDDTPTIKGSRRKGKEKLSGSTWLKEGEDDEPLDFMDSSVTQRIIGTRPMKRSRESTKTFKVGLDGRMIIHDDETTMEKTEVDVETMLVEVGGGKRLKRKRKLSDSASDGEEQQGVVDMKGVAGGGSGIHRKDPKKMSFKDHGGEYRAKKAKGDMKRPGKPDPYAYIQLDRQKLNRRKRAKLSGEFRGILNRAKKGATKGRKQKRK